MKNPHIILLDGKLWAFEPPEKPYQNRKEGIPTISKSWEHYDRAYSLALEQRIEIDKDTVPSHLLKLLKENEPIKWEGEVVITPESSGPTHFKPKLVRLIAPVKEENSAMSYTEGSDYTLSRESDEPGIQLNTNISTSPVPSENSKPRESETIEAWKAWEDDQRTNPIPVNPHAFAYGYNIAKNKYSQPVPSEQEKQEDIWKEMIDLYDTTDRKSYGYQSLLKMLTGRYVITRK